MVKKIATIEGLATLMQNEFLSIHEKLDDMSREITDIKSELMDIRNDLDNLKLRMGEAAYRFELKELEKRVSDLEFYIKRNLKKA